jgi:hypothetical protein
MIMYLRLELDMAPCPGSRAARTGSPDSEREWWGPVVRRVLGNALIEAHCPFRVPRCRGEDASVVERCRLAESCPYGVLFAASLSRRPPWALHVPRVAAGDPIERVEVTLLGPGWPLFPWVVTGLERALRAGVGRERRGYRSSRVLRVRLDRTWEELCGADPSELPPALEPDDVPRHDRTPDEALRTVEVRLISPLRLKREGKLVRDDDPVPLRELVARILDRWDAVRGPDEETPFTPEARRELEARAAEAALVGHDVGWVEVRDYSAAKRSELLLGGKLGRLVFDGVPPDVLSVLRAGEVLHVGKNPTSGCGRIEVTTHLSCGSVQQDDLSLQEG